ncbi:MAG TPA: HAD family hydrolase [Syntrophorhabdales bacterium]|nr:HAD family hydrolase [Syntrophorhabdales bacterium]
MKPKTETRVGWKNVRGVIFDVDGTLYDQRKLRLMMLLELGKCLFQGGITIRDIRVIRHFRKVRENLATKEAHDVSRRQLVTVANALSVSPERVAALVEAWIYRKPLKYMSACRFPRVDGFFDALRTRGVRIGVFSDYPAEEKLTALSLQADAVCYSLEPGLHGLKPQSLGLETVVRRLGLDVSECLFIGDRASRDGECALRVSMPFLLCRGRDFYKELMIDFLQPQ